MLFFGGVHKGGGIPVSSYAAINFRWNSKVAMASVMTTAAAAAALPHLPSIIDYYMALLEKRLPLGTLMSVFHGHV